MLKKLLGLVFNRWVLGAVLLLAVLGVVWIIGPLVAVGDMRPLDGVRARWLTTAAIVLGVAAWVAWRAWRARRGNAQVVAHLVAAPAGPVANAESADLALVRGRFEAALSLLRQARFGVAAGASGASGGAGSATGAWRKLNDRFSGRYLYQLPWYLIIGAPGSGKTTALRNAGLQFPLASKMGEQAVRGVGGTRACDWWFTDRAVLIDTAGRFTTQDSDPANDQATWAGFLALLKKSRPRQPVNGVLVTVAVPDLLAKSAAERQRHAHTVRARVQELHQELGIRLPIYLLVTKCDLMAGFTETFEALGKAVRAAPWGFTFALPAAAGVPPVMQQAMQQEMQALQTRLDQGLIDRLQAEADPPRRERIYGFPNQFASLHAPVQDFVDQVFAPSPFETEPMLRGVYFVSGTQEGTPIDRVLGAVARRYRLEQAMLPSQRAGGRSYFLEQVVSNVVLAEQGLAGTRRGWERRRQAAALGAYALLGLLACAALAAWWVSWHGNTRYIEAVAKRVGVASGQLQQTPNQANAELRPLLPALQATQGLARASLDESAAVPWSLGFGLYQGRRLDAAAQFSYQQMLRDAMLPRLALRFENQLRMSGQPDALYEALKVYVMLYDLPHFDAAALKAQIQADWQLSQDRSLSNEQRESLGNHLDALLDQGPAVSPLPKDQALIDTTRKTLAATGLPQRVYSRLRQRGLGEGFAEFTVVKAGGSSAPLVFNRASGQPLTRGVPGLFTYKGYHEGFQAVVGEATRQLADEQGWVLGVAGSDARGAQALLAPGKLTDDVRRLYLTEYRDTWKAFIADVRMLPAAGVSQALERTRFLAAPDTPLLPLLKAMSRETTLLASSGPGGALQDSARGAVETFKGKALGTLGAKPNLGTPGERIESIVDDEFSALRRQVTAPEGGKAPIETVLARLGDLQVLLTATDTALKGGAAPPPSPLPNQIRADAANAPEPLRTLLDTLGGAAGRGVASQLRETLSRDVRSQVGEFCQQAIAGRYPFDASAAREVTPADFAAMFGPGGKFELMQQKLAPYIDTSTRPWSFRPLEGASMGSDAGTLPQFQRAATIRETFFQGGVGPATQLVFKPVEMDQGLKEFSLDVDGQPVRYDHGPQIPQPVRWPGPRGSGVVRVAVQPAGGTGMLKDGPWALFRLFEQVDLQPGTAPEKFRATFNIDGRKAVFDITAGSVRNPLRMPELRSFACPMGL